MSDLSLLDAREHSRSRTLLRRLCPLYLHDLSQFTDFYRLDSRARWTPNFCEDWLTNPLIDPFLLKASADVVGFAIVSHAPFRHMSTDRDHKLLEFFIAAPSRRAGFGRAAASLVFDRFPGSWELSIIPANSGATSFWNSILAAYTSMNFETLDLTGDISMRFHSRR